MKLIQIMNYHDPHHPCDKVPDRDFGRRREAVRAVVRDEAGGVYLMHAASHGYYKLPGGGVDPGEDRLVALDREIHEEMGGRIEVQGEVGHFIQFDEIDDFRHDSYCYVARLMGKLGAPELTASEAEAGFEVARFDDIDAALAAVRSPHEAKYDYMTVRDATLLEAAAELDGA
jgi:8-oxo-dGTP diphosphatase